MPFSLEATRKQQAVDRVVVDDKHVCLRDGHVRLSQPRLERARHAGVLLLDPSDELDRACERPRLGAELELFAQGCKPGRAERPPVRLQGMSGSAQLLEVALLERASELPNEAGRILEERGDQLADEGGIADSCFEFCQVDRAGIVHFVRCRRVLSETARASAPASAAASSSLRIGLLR